MAVSGKGSVRRQKQRQPLDLNVEGEKYIYNFSGNISNLDVLEDFPINHIYFAAGTNT